MDVTGDEDLKLQQDSGARIAKFHAALPKFLWRSDPNHSVRRLVRHTKTDLLIQLLEPFQESPQLLDPHLNSFVTSLTAAYLTYLTTHAGDYNRSFRAKPSSNAIPLPRAVCRILNNLCKIRGQKVICQLLSHDHKFLEPMLDAFQDWSRTGNGLDNEQAHGPMEWQERFLTLLWLSQIVLEPFDLRLMSSENPNQDLDFTPMRVELPQTVPGLAKRLVHVSMIHLTSSGKERETARLLLVRMALRSDMIRLGLHTCLAGWSISCLEKGVDINATRSIYASIGLLSFLAGLMASAENAIRKPLLKPVLELVRNMTTDEHLSYHAIRTSAMSRKLVIKIYRTLSVCELQLEAADSTNVSEGSTEDAIDYLLSALADRDTPVRLAASKALSMIVLELHDDGMAAQVVEEVVAVFQDNVFWENAETGELASSSDPSRDLIEESAVYWQNLSAVNPLMWHGRVLTLSHLLFRRSPPLQLLPRILDSLILALGFEQRSPSGSSVGTNVRDAACFGIWSLARRYVTQELLTIDASTLTATSSGFSASILQILANELVVASSLDPSGNIRRGASAALQELIGRHPDTIIDGIHLIQIVDYHAVALRSRAILEVAFDASKLHQTYWTSLFQGLLNWRGVGSPDAPSRRVAAEGIGLLACHFQNTLIGQSISTLQSRLNVCSLKVERRHGLLLALAAIARQIRQRAALIAPMHDTVVDIAIELWRTFPLSTAENGSQILRDEDLTRGTLRPELTAEAVCSLISSLAVLTVSTAPENRTVPPICSIRRCIRFIELSLLLSSEIAIKAAAQAAADILPILSGDAQSEKFVRYVIDKGESKSGCVAAEGAMLLHAPDRYRSVIVTNLINATLPNELIERRVIALRALGVAISDSRGCGQGVLSLISEDLSRPDISKIMRICLEDYTTDHRGDVGSLVRVEAINVFHVFSQVMRPRNVVSEGDQILLKSNKIFAMICGLAAEKLDKVRLQAWKSLQDEWIVFGRDERPPRTFADIADISTVGYFQQLLEYCYPIDWIRLQFLTGYITSAGAGSEALQRASRAALVAHAKRLATPKLLGFLNCMASIIEKSKVNERLNLPALEIFSFLLDAGVFQAIDDLTDPWQSLARTIKSLPIIKGKGAIRKLEAIVGIWGGLIEIDAVRAEALGKLTKLLRHRYPSICNAAADTLLIHAPSDDLFKTDWSQLGKEALRLELHLAKGGGIVTLSV